MDNPYRQMDPKEDIINTRLDGLEKHVEHDKWWRGAVGVTIALMVASFVITYAACARARDSAVCRNEVKSQRGVGTIMCDHRSHKMVLLERDENHVIISCACE